MVTSAGIRQKTAEVEEAEGIPPNTEAPKLHGTGRAHQETTCKPYHSCCLNSPSPDASDLFIHSPQQFCFKYFERIRESSTGNSGILNIPGTWVWCNDPFGHRPGHRLSWQRSKFSHKTAETTSKPRTREQRFRASLGAWLRLRHLQLQRNILRYRLAVSLWAAQTHSLSKQGAQLWSLGSSQDFLAVPTSPRASGWTTIHIPLQTPCLPSQSSRISSPSIWKTDKLTGFAFLLDASNFIPNNIQILVFHCSIHILT